MLSLLKLLQASKDIVAFVSPPCAVTKIADPIGDSEGIIAYAEQGAVSTSSSYVVC